MSKTISLLFLFLILISFVVTDGFYYYLGYSESSYSFHDDAIFVTLIAFIFDAIIIWKTIISYITRKNRRWMLMVLGGMIACNIVGYFANHLVPPKKFILFGMRDRIKHDGEWDNLLRFGYEFDRLPELNQHRDFPIGEKIYDVSDLRPLGLNRKYPFLEWIKKEEGGQPGPSYVYEFNHMVGIRWGSGVRGQWGINIYLYGQNPHTVSNALNYFARKNDNYLVRGNDNVYFEAEP